MFVMIFAVSGSERPLKEQEKYEVRQTPLTWEDEQDINLLRSSCVMTGGIDDFCAKRLAELEFSLKRHNWEAAGGGTGTAAHGPDAGQMLPDRPDVKTPDRPVWCKTPDGWEPC